MKELFGVCRVNFLLVRTFLHIRIAQKLMETMYHVKKKNENEILENNMDNDESP